MSSTIKDVAKKANVSTATVSRILNGLPGYSDETREKVLKVIKELNYQPNAIARGLVNKRTKTLGVLLPNVSSMFASEILNGIEDTAHEADYSVIVCNTDSNGVRTLKYLQVLNEKRVDGIIFTSEELKDEYYKAMKEMNIPIILVSTSSEKYPLPYVKVDDLSAAYSATEYLIKNGHKKIAMITGRKEDKIAGLPRIEGYKKALKDYGIPFDENRIAYGDAFGFSTGITFMEELLEKAPDTTAVFAASDEIAIGAMSVANKYNIKIPDDLSIIGYDNLKIAEMTVPPLTTIGQPLYEIGKNSANLIVKMIDTKETVESKIISHQIIERQTVKKLVE